MAKKRRLEGCAFLPCGVSLPRGQRKGGNPFSRRCVMASPPPCRQRKNNSHSPDPPAFGRLRTGKEAPTRRRHAAFFVGGLRVVLKRAPVRFPEILLRMFPRAFKKEPLPCALRVRFAVAFVLDRGKEFVRCPTCGVVRVLRDMQAFGPCSCADR